MPVPTLLPTTAQNETFGGVTYHIEGELVPALHVELSNTGIYFEHHILLWKDPVVQIALHPMKGAFKRMLAGMPFLLTGATGPGRIAFSRDGAGHVFGLRLKPGTGVDVREHQWLAATDAVEYSFTRVKGAANMLLGGTGFFIDTFTCPTREGILWLHGFGNVFEVTLGPGEQLTSSRAAGFTRTAPCRCRPCSRNSRRDFLPAPGRLFGTGSPARAKSHCNPCISTWKAGNKMSHEARSL